MATTGLHYVRASPVAGLAVAERRVVDPRATVVAVHGALDRASSFARLARRLTDFDAVTYDRRGYQVSRDLVPVDFTHHVDDLLAIVADEARRLPVIVFGHSFGGLVAWGAALREPTVMRLCVNYETPLPWVVARTGAREALAHNPDDEVEHFFRRVVSNESWDRLSELQRESRRRDGAALRRDLATVRDPTPPFDIANLTVPTIYAYGDGATSDYYRRLAMTLTATNDHVRSERVGHADHAAHLTVPDRLATLIRHGWELACASA